MRILQFFMGAFVVLLYGCNEDEATIKSQTLDYTWESGDEGWRFGYSDYPANLSLGDSLELYAMNYGHRTLPAEILPAQKGMLIAGANRSDDLFMYLFKTVEGLTPSAEYSVEMEVQLASNAPTNAVGIGGAPGEAVTIKAGATSNEPRVVIEDGWYRMNLDKGNQSIGGSNMVVIGNAGVKDDTRQYELITRKTDSPLKVKADSNGKIWLIVGSDSGFEGYTALYYAQLRVTIRSIPD
ncbi:MAG: hypothetical protein RL161_56 [Bacteroidota bacterium]